MLDAIDLILKLVAFASLSAVTMVTFESVRKFHRLFDSKKFLHYSIIVMWLSGGTLIFVEGYINSRAKTIANEALNSQITSQKETNQALKKQIENQQAYSYSLQRYDVKSDNRHREDTTNFKKQNDILVNIIYGLLKTSKKTLDTSSKTYQAVGKLSKQRDSLTEENNAPIITIPWQIPNNPRIYKNSNKDSLWFKIYISSSKQTESYAPRETFTVLSLLTDDSFSICFNRENKIINMSDIMVQMANDTRGYTEGFPIIGLSDDFIVYFKVKYRNRNGQEQEPLRRIFGCFQNKPGQVYPLSEGEQYDYVVKYLKLKNIW